MIVALAHIFHELDPVFGTHMFENVWYDLRSGVDLFFVLSGFIIVFVTGRHFGNASYRPNFFYRRITRIVPIYWVYTSLMLAIVLAAPSLAASVKTSPEHTIASYLFIPWPNPDGALGPLLGVGWTLLYEMMFYVTFTFVIGLKMWRAIGALAVVFIGLVVARALFHTQMPFYLDYWSNPMILEFLAGAVIAGLYLQFRTRFHWALGLGLTLFAFAWYAIGWHMPAFAGQERVVLLGIPSALIIFALTFGTKGLPAGLKWPHWLVVVGNSSYSLYLSHFFTIGASVAILEKLGLIQRLPAVSWILPILAVCVIVGLVSYLLIEKPVMEFARRQEPKLRKRPVAGGV